MQATHDMSLNALFFNAFASRRRPLGNQIIRPMVSAHESERLRELLVKKTPAELTNGDFQTVIEGNLWILTSEAFLYFLPEFLWVSLESYGTVNVFASELIGALTEPSRTDIEVSVNRLSVAPQGLGLPTDLIDLLRRQQLEWVDSGTPSAIFHERFDCLSNAEGGAVLAFLTAFQEAHGKDFPFQEVETCIERYWSRYRGSQ